METGELLTRWTVRVAVASYFLALLIRLSRPQSTRRLQRARILWTLAYGVFVIHVACAFHFFHHWSHAAAFAETARRTIAVVGIAVGAGVYVNYLFMLLWGLDVANWWRCGLHGYERLPKRYHVPMQSFLAFIFLNGTIVFEPGFSRWLGIVGFSLLAVAYVRRRLTYAGDQFASRSE